MILHYGTSNDNANVELKVYRWKHSVIDPQVELERVGEELRCVEDDVANEKRNKLQEPQLTGFSDQMKSREKGSLVTCCTF